MPYLVPPQGGICCNPPPAPYSHRKPYNTAQVRHFNIITGGTLAKLGGQECFLRTVHVR